MIINAIHLTAFRAFTTQPLGFIDLEPVDNGDSIEITIKKLRNACTPDLLKPIYQKNYLPQNPLLGHCYHLSEALYFTLGGPLRGWSSVCARDQAGSSHWWLCNNKGYYLDGTIDQFLNLNTLPPYLTGARVIKCGFMGQRKLKNSPWGFGLKPGNKAMFLLEKSGLI